MLCPICDQQGNRWGKNRNGTQRYFCRSCLLAYSEEREPVQRVFADRQMPMETAVRAIEMLCEGMSIRGVCRLLHIGQHTLLNLVIRVGEVCVRLQQQYIVGVPCQRVQCDELWSFCKMKEKKRVRKGLPEGEIGDCYTWTGMCRDSKLMLAYAVGKRDNSTAMEFVRNLRRATSGRFQIDTDGWSTYRSVIPLVFGFGQDHAQVVKIFSTPTEDDVKYSPGQIVGMTITVGSGNPDLDNASTSFVERSNLTVRMMLRRFARLTNAHSKSWRHHEAAIGLMFGVYNFTRRHMTLKGKTPAMAAHLTDHRWSIRELVERVIPRDSPAIAS